MTRSFPPNLSKLHLALLGVSLIFVATVVALVIAVLQSWQAFNSLKSWQIEAAYRYGQRAQPIVRVADELTFHKITALRSWRLELELISEIPTAKDMMTSALEGGRFENPSRLISLAREFEQSSQQSKKISAAIDLLELFLTEKTRWVVVFQNSDELRATGGFIGSWAEIELEKGQITDFKILDVYEADGRFEGFRPAPPGVTEYLSQGQGWRLPDANWSPHFPTSAQTFLDFLSDSDFNGYTGLVAVNLDFFENLLQVTGPVFLPDFGVTATTQNVSALARADREQFFPGSKAKTNFLTSLYTQFKIKLGQMLDQEFTKTGLKLANSFNQAQADYAFQTFSPDPNTQSALSSLDLDGQTLDLDQKQSGLGIFESNVGINKANAGVDRIIETEQLDYRTFLTVTFTNHNSLDNLNEGGDYVNYLRLVTTQNLKLDKVSIDGQEVDTWQEISPNSLPKGFKEFGQLVIVPQQKVVTVRYEISHPKLENQHTFFRQPGVIPI